MAEPLVSADAAGRLAVRADWVAARTEVLLRHSPYSYIRELPTAPQQVHYGAGVAQQFGNKAREEVLPMQHANGQWLVQKLAWDTDYFNTPTYRLFTGLFEGAQSGARLVEAATALQHELAQRGPFYAFSIVPAEDTMLLQALTGGGWQLIETRLNFYCRVTEAVLPAPACVRLARPDEAAHIGRISAAARNPYDRFHADPWFGEARADAFLARYAGATVADGYADAVLLPDESGLPVDSFLAIGDTAAIPDIANSEASRILLTAVGPQNRGWHLKLVAETVRRAANLSLPYVFMTTQATNSAVFRTCEKLGFRLGSTAHVLACHHG